MLTEGRVERPTVHSAEDGTILAIAVASVQEPAEPVLGTDEVWPPANTEPVMETGDAPTPMIEDQTPEEEVARTNTDTEQEIVPMSPPLTPVSTAATVMNRASQDSNP
jgi:hypothetical protein